VSGSGYTGNSHLDLSLPTARAGDVGPAALGEEAHFLGRYGGMCHGRRLEGGKIQRTLYIYRSRREPGSLHFSFGLSQPEALK
jgi:hypothetical protein